MCVGEGLCYHENTVIEKYLNDPSMRSLLGVTAPQNFTSCASGVGMGFRAHMDKYVAPTQHYIAELLARGVRVLIYAGTYDWQCNWVANRLWVEQLEWAGQKEFNAQEWKTWGLGDNVTEKTGAGITKSSGLLTFASVWGAGHMVRASAVDLGAKLNIRSIRFPSISLQKHWL